VITWAGWQHPEAIGNASGTQRPPWSERLCHIVSVEKRVDNRLTLTKGLHAPAHARAWVSARTPGLARDTTEDALLIVSELVTNAVRHGDGDIVVGLDVRADRVRIEVRDDSPELPVIPTEHPPTDRPAGRGLLIVAATASDWGVERARGAQGKTVWAELHLSGPRITG
jgi:anti-sigma regulatory factor (Ser/Thr protein kinase)